MKVISYLFLSVYSFLFGFVPDKPIIAELVKIEYYSKGVCTNTPSIYVRVLYKVSGEKPENLKMKHFFPGGITSTMPVTEKDKKGNCVYGFCLNKDEKKEFSTVFISSDGELSNKIYVNIDVSKANIISGTAPFTIKCN